MHKSGTMCTWVLCTHTPHSPIHTVCAEPTHYVHVVAHGVHKVNRVHRVQIILQFFASAGAGLKALFPITQLPKSI